MEKRQRNLLAASCIVMLLALGVTPSFAAGFAIYEQGAKAMGMAGAFTAQSDDPSAMFYNLGGVAFFEEQEFYAGISLISLGDSTFQGALPYPGTDATGEQVDQIVTPPHFYWVRPINKKLVFGLGLNSPFGLVTEWDDPDDWSGRFLSEKAELINIDLNPNVGFRLSEKTGISVGLIVRVAEVELKSRQATINPFTSQPAEISKNTLTSDFETGIGWNLGILHKFNDRASLGFNYRSRISVEFGGEAEFEQVLTGDPIFDGIVEGQLPGQPVSIGTEIEFPDQANIGFAYRFGSKWVAELDIVWTGWSSFDTLTVEFDPASGLDPLVRPQGWDDSRTYRGGAQYTIGDRSQFRFGLYFDESPQPSYSVSPLLPDAERWGYSLGYGYTGNKIDVDAYVLYVAFDDRTTLDNLDGFYGTYSTNVLILGASVGF